MKNIILVTGAESYLGWNLILHLSKKPNTTIICVDNLYKQRFSDKKACKKLYEACDIYERITIFNRITENKGGKKIPKNNITFEFGNLSNYYFTEMLIIKYKPTLIIHLAQQSINNLCDKDTDISLLTHDYNTTALLNITWALRNMLLKTPIIKLGTLQPPENFLEFTKNIESQYAQYISNKFNVKIIDLLIGSLYGFKTPHTAISDKLLPTLYYDNDFSTITDRFIIETAIGTDVFIKGNKNKKLAVIDINDMLQVFDLIIKNIKKYRKYTAINTFSEMLSVKEIVEILQQISETMNLKTTFTFVNKLNIEHNLNHNNDALQRLGYKPTKFKNNVKKIIKDIRCYEVKENE